MRTSEKDIKRGIEEYLAVRRAMGRHTRENRRELIGFAVFLARNGAERITTDLAGQWVSRGGNLKDVCTDTRRNRLAMIRGFAKYWSAFDPKTEIPPADLITGSSPRGKPHIFTEEEILRLMKAALRLDSWKGFRPWTYYTLLGLLAATGLRPGEARGLDCRDVDLHSGVLTIRRGKGGKSRLIPVHPTTTRVLGRYLQRRNRLFQPSANAPFFLSDRGKRLDGGVMGTTFRNLRLHVGLAKRPDERHDPRLVDFRHTFASRALLVRRRRQRDVDEFVPVLSAYLGHVGPTSTYWYFSVTPELLAVAGDRLEKRLGDLQ